MKTFDDFKIEREKHEIATLICNLGIDPDAYFEQVISEGIFKDGFRKLGNMWKKHVTAPNVVRLQSSYDKAQQSVDNFVKNFYALRNQKMLPQSAGGLHTAIKNVKQNLDMMKDQVGSIDQHAQQGVMDKSYGDIKNWDGSTGVGKQAWDAAQKGYEYGKQGYGYAKDKIGQMNRAANPPRPDDPNPIGDMIQPGAGIPSDNNPNDHTGQGKGKGTLQDPSHSELPGAYPNLSVAHKSGYAKNSYGKLVPYDQAGYPNSKDNPEYFGLVSAEWAKFLKNKLTG